jgi:hypothetical protein
VRKKEKDRSIDTLRRKLIKIGIYSAPIVASISIPDIKIQAQTPVEKPPEEPPGGDIPAPTFRKKNIIEEEKNKDRKNKKKRLSLMDDLDERGNYIFESPFRKPRSKLRKKQEEDEE